MEAHPETGCSVLDVESDDARRQMSLGTAPAGEGTRRGVAL
jgi:hypothetical protein